jgi:hypothetical protein
VDRHEVGVLANQVVSLQPVDLASHDQTEGPGVYQLMEAGEMSVRDLDIRETTTGLVSAG